MKSTWRSAKNWLARLAVAATLALLSLGARAQNLSLPLGVAVDGNSNIYVANFFGGITVYGPNFAKKAVITQGVDSPDDVAVGPDGTIYAANNAGNSITEYSPGSFAQKSLTIPVSQPTQAVVGSYNEIYAVQANGAVSMFDPLGELRSQVTVVDTETLVITPTLAQFWWPTCTRAPQPSSTIFLRSTSPEA